MAQAKISIGYEHATCINIVWETQTAKLQGFDVDISDVGGWSLDIHHHYNFHEGNSFSFLLLLSSWFFSLQSIYLYCETVQV